jgi:hypothetical protein
MSKPAHNFTSIYRLCFSIIIIFLSGASVQAQPWDGGGIEGDPFLIYDANDMQAIGANSNYWDRHFKLMADIDLGGFTGTSFNIIGNDSIEFTGVFDGNGHSISNFTYSSTDIDYIGLFGKIVYEDCQIKNVELIAPNVSAGTGDYIGALVGRVRDGATLSNCHINDGSVSGNNDVGGLLGELSLIWLGIIQNCSCTADVFGNDYVGGLIGSCSSPDPIYECYAGGDVSGNTRIGGLVGHNDNAEIRNCYAFGNISGVDKVGGLLGVANSTVMYSCYSVGDVNSTGVDVGGLVGGYYGGDDLTKNCFWDTQTSGQPYSAVGTGKTTPEMKDPNTFIGWGCNDAWMINAGIDYPRLAWQSLPGELITNPSYGGGSGTEVDPYLIYTAEGLNRIGLIPCDLDKYFKLMADVDLADLDEGNFNVIGGLRYHFRGVFDGNGHTISNLSYNSSESYHVGFFGLINGGEVRDLGLINPNVSAGTKAAAGSLAGSSDGKVSRCYAVGGIVSGSSEIGGLIGCNDGGIITDCYAQVEISGGGSVGGLVGDNWNVISRCYSTGRVSSGLYSGGLVGKNTGQVNDSFWDIETSGQSSSAGGTGKTTAEMQTESTFTDVGWDFTGEAINGPNDIWAICEGTNYPRFSWQILVADFVCPDGVGLRDYAVLAEQWQQVGEHSADIAPEGGDGVVNWLDLAVFAENWLAEP